MKKGNHRKGDLAAALLKSIRNAIISGELKPGSHLRQEKLAKTYASSRIPIREALKALNAEGLVHFQSNRGAVVAPIDPLELRENYEMRQVSEGLAIKLAIPQLSNAQIDKAAAIQGQIDTCDFENFGILNKQLHITLYEPCNRPRLLSHISTLHDIAERYLRFTLTTFDYIKQSSKEHRDIIEACYQRDVNLAHSLTSSHIVEAGRTLEKFLLENNALTAPHVL